MGLSGEVGEIAQVMLFGDSPISDKLIDEVGDLLWYFSRLVDAGGAGKWPLETLWSVASSPTFCFGGIRIFGETFPPIEDQDLDRTALGLCAAADSRVTDYIKKVIFHKHQLDEDRLYRSLIYVLMHVRVMLKFLRVDVQEVTQRNIDKLKRRYPNGFTYADSQNRKEA